MIRTLIRLLPFIGDQPCRCVACDVVIGYLAWSYRRQRWLCANCACDRQPTFLGPEQG